MNISELDQISAAIATNNKYICEETLADEIVIMDNEPKNGVAIEFDDIKTYIALIK